MPRRRHRRRLRALLLAACDRKEILPAGRTIHPARTRTGTPADRTGRRAQRPDDGAGGGPAKNPHPADQK